MVFSRRWRAWCCLWTAVGLWGTTSVVLYYLAHAGGFETQTMNFYRYGSSSVALLAIVAWRYRAAVRWSRRLLLGVGLVALPNLVYQTCLVQGLQVIRPGFAALLLLLITPFSVLLAWLFVPEERRHIRSRRFLPGLLLALVGAAGVIVFRESFTLTVVKAGVARVAGPGLVAWSTGLLVLAALFWGVYSLCVRRLMAGEHPVVSFALVSVLMTLLFLPLAGLEGDLRQVRAAPGPVLLLLGASGVLLLAVGHTFYYEAIRVLGVALPATALLLCPLIAGAASWVVNDERLTLGQWGAGALLIAGAALSLWSRHASSAREQDAR